MAAAPEMARNTTHLEEQKINRTVLVTFHVGLPGDHGQQQPGVQAAFIKEIKVIVTVLGLLWEILYIAYMCKSNVIGTRGIVNTQVTRQHVFPIFLHQAFPYFIVPAHLVGAVE